MLDSYPKGKPREKAINRLVHVKQHLEGGFDVSGMTSHIINGTGNPSACAEGLSLHALASAVYSWYGCKELGLMKNWMFVSANLIRHHRFLGEISFTPIGHMLNFFTPLSSDNQLVINWYVDAGLTFDKKRIYLPSTQDFLLFQLYLAIKGEWSELASRSELVLSGEMNATATKFKLDYEFFSALALGDEKKMTDSLLGLVTQKSIRSRSSLETGYNDGLISSFATMYAKIAWRHGFELEVDTPYIPREWLPVSPLQEYDPVYSFLKDS